MYLEEMKLRSDMFSLSSRISFFNFQNICWQTILLYCLQKRHGNHKYLHSKVFQIMRLEYHAFFTIRYGRKRWFLLRWKTLKLYVKLLKWCGYYDDSIIFTFQEFAREPNTCIVRVNSTGEFRQFYQHIDIPIDSNILIAIGNFSENVSIYDVYKAAPYTEMRYNNNYVSFYYLCDTDLQRSLFTG